MSTEENVPSNAEAFRLAVRRHNAPMIRKQRIHFAIKLLSGGVLAAIIVASVIYVTNLLLSNHTSDSPSPTILINTMAIVGAILIVGMVVAVMAIITSTIFALMEVGFDSSFIPMGVVRITVTIIVSTIVTTLYLAAFFNA